MRSPLEIPVVVRTPFGVPYNIRGVAGKHEGVDLVAPAGSWLVGPFTGHVEHYGRDGYGEGPAGNGTWLCLVPDVPAELPPELVGHNVQVLCLHLSRSDVIVGSTFEPGQRIAATGYTGFVEPEGPAGAHLHLEVHVDGVPVDPASLPGLVTSSRSPAALRVSSPTIAGDETTFDGSTAAPGDFDGSRVDPSDFDGSSAPPGDPAAFVTLDPIPPSTAPAADPSRGAPVPETAAPLKLHLSPSGVVGLIRDAFKLGKDLAKFLPGGISADEASQLVADAAAFASDVAGLLLPTMAPA